MKDTNTSLTLFLFCSIWERYHYSADDSGSRAWDASLGRYWHPRSRQCDTAKDDLAGEKQVVSRGRAAEILGENLAAHGLATPVRHNNETKDASRLSSPNCPNW